MIAPSCTCIKLQPVRRGAGRAQLPTMHACSSLTYLQVTSHRAFDVEIAAAKLPPQHISIGTDISGRLFVEAYADKHFRFEKASCSDEFYFMA